YCNDLLMPVMVNSRDELIDVLVVEQVAVTTCNRQVWPHDLSRQSVAAIVEIRGTRALDPGNLNGCAEQSRALHPDADHSESHRVARRDMFAGFRLGFLTQENRSRGQ